MLDFTKFIFIILLLNIKLKQAYYIDYNLLKKNWLQNMLILENLFILFFIEYLKLEEIYIINDYIRLIKKNHYFL
jgi:hypothetical protein